MLIVGVNPPLLLIGAVPDTDDTYERAGMSATTRVLNVGVAAGPLEGPANTALAGSVVKVPVRVPLLVTGLPVTVKMDGNDRPTLVTVPPPPPPELPLAE